MALTQGINGTFAPAWTDDVTDYASTRKIVKKMQRDDGVWEDRTFIMLTDGTNRGQVQSWLKEHYGHSVYCVNWWPTFNSVCMLDKIYTHWRLCE